MKALRLCFVDYFDEQAYLTQSGQLYIEATAMALARSTHSTDFPGGEVEDSPPSDRISGWSKPEIAYATLDDLMQLAEDFIGFLVKRCLDRRASDLQIIGRDISKLAKIEARSRALLMTKQ